MEECVKDEVISKVVLNMQLNERESKKLENILRITLHDLVLTKMETALSTQLDENDYVLRQFVATKKLEGSSMKSLEQYVRATRMMLDTLNKSFKDVKTGDIKYYLAMYQNERKISQNTLANMKRFISSFFSWAENEELISKNPCRAIKSIKQTQKEKTYLKDSEIERMREATQTAREKAIFEFLLSTGVRVSEAVNLNIDDVDLDNKTVRIYATKTRTFRVGYLNARAELMLRNYLAQREDDTKALFVATKGKNERLGAKSIEKEMQDVAIRAGIMKKVTVHLFRKTLATRLNRQGVDIVIIKEILGHANISVTEKNYVSVDQNAIKAAHSRCA